MPHHYEWCKLKINNLKILSNMKKRTLNLEHKQNHGPKLVCLSKMRFRSLKLFGIPIC